MILDDFSLSGKTVVVMGGDGLVGTICQETIRELGSNPIVIDLKAGDIECDLSNKYTVSRLPEQIMNVDVLINCQVGNQKPVKHPGDHWDHDIVAGLTAVFNTCYAFGLDMSRRDGGVILNFGSDLSHIAPDHSLYAPGMVKPASYSAVKSGILGLTRYFAVMWPNVRCNALCPGGVDIGQSIPRNPLGRLMEPRELKGAIALLISRAGSYFNGAIINLDGGRTAI